jgi:preprotein translocase subunit YajC
MGAIVVIAILLLLAWLLLALPHRRRQRAHAAMQDALEVGDEIITAGGLHAVVRELAGAELRVEIAPGVLATLDRRAVAAVAEDVPEPEEAVGVSEAGEAASPAERDQASRPSGPGTGEEPS